LAKVPGELAKHTPPTDSVNKYFLNVLITYLSIPIALRMSLRVFVKKRRPPKPAFFAYMHYLQLLILLFLAWIGCFQQILRRNTV